MDLLAPILAYLGTVAAMIAAVAISYDVFVYTPLHSTVPPQTRTFAAKPSASKKAATPTVSIARGELPVAQRVRRNIAAAETAPQADTVAKLRTARLRRARTRRLAVRGPARQGPAREWASGRSPEAFGYADEPRALFDYDPFR